MASTTSAKWHVSLEGKAAHTAFTETLSDFFAAAAAGRMVALNFEDEGGDVVSAGFRVWQGLALFDSSTIPLPSPEDEGGEDADD